MITVQGLVKRYGQRIAVNGVSFSVQGGLCFGIGVRRFRFEC
jgi:ABC-type multidrug transport system ATPase subunit